MPREALLLDVGPLAGRFADALEAMGYRTVGVRYRDGPVPGIARRTSRSLELPGRHPSRSPGNGAEVAREVAGSGVEAVHPGASPWRGSVDLAQALDREGVRWLGSAPRTLRALEAPPSVDAPVARSAEEAGRWAEEVGAGGPVVLEGVPPGPAGRVDVAAPGEVAAAWRSLDGEAAGGPVLVRSPDAEPRLLEVVVGHDGGRAVPLVLREPTLRWGGVALLHMSPPPGLDEATRQRVRDRAREAVAERSVEDLVLVRLLLTSRGPVPYHVEPGVPPDLAAAPASGPDPVRWSVAGATRQGDGVREQAPVHRASVPVHPRDPLRGFEPSTAAEAVPVHLSEETGGRWDHALVPGAPWPVGAPTPLAVATVSGGAREATLDALERVLSRSRVGDGATTLGVTHHALRERRVQQDPSLDVGSVVEAHRAAVRGAVALVASGWEHQERGRVTVDGHTLPWERVDGRVVVEGVPAAPRGEVRDVGSLELAGRRVAVHGEPELPEPPRRAVTGPLEVRSPVPGTVLEVRVAAGDEVAEGETLVVLEAMKMRNRVDAPVRGTVRDVEAEAEAVVEQGSVLLRMDPAP